MQLGQGTNHAYVYDRTGRTRLAELVCSSLTWPRTLNQIGRAQLSIAASNCTADLSKLSTWGHSIVIYRDNDRVWEGPVRRVTHRPDGLDVDASDVLGWTERRAIRTARTLASATVLDELQWTISQAFAPDDPNVLAYLQKLGTDQPGASIARDLAADSDYHAGDLSTLAGAGGRFTALGRSILLWTDGYPLGTAGQLVPERHLLADVTVTEDGDSAATRVTARDDNGITGVYDPTGAPDPFYGVLDAVIGVGGAQTPAALTAAATAARATAYPAPVTVDVPDDAQLRPDAPFPLSSLVPGTLVPVSTRTATGRRVDATAVLSAVKVTQSGDEAEKVTISLTTASALTGS